jgi:hypothetical protein
MESGTGFFAVVFVFVFVFGRRFFSFALASEYAEHEREYERRRSPYFLGG